MRPGSEVVAGLVSGRETHVPSHAPQQSFGAAFIVDAIVRQNAVSSRFSCRRLTEGSCASRRNGADGLPRSLGLARLLPLLQVGDLGERLAGVDLAAQAVLLLEHVHGAVGELHGLFLGEHHYAVVVADDPVAGSHRLAGDDDRHADLAEALGLAGVGAHLAAEGGEAEARDLRSVADRAPHDEAGDALDHGAVRGQLAPHGGGGVAGVDHEHVAGLADVDGLHGLGPVAGVGAHGDRRAAHVRARQQRPDARQARLAMPGVADVGRRHLLEDAADVGLAGALEERRLDADALVDRAADLGGSRAVDERVCIETTLFKRAGEADIRSILEQVSTANVSDAWHRQPSLPGIRPLLPGAHMCGPAVTVRTYAGDWAKPVEAIDVCKPGDVLVIDACDATPAMWGELATHSAMVKGIAGLVVWGAIRDTPEIARLGFPAFSSKVCANAGEPKGFGEIGVPIVIAGQTVRPGDWIVGDDDGVMVLPKKQAVELANRAMDVLEKENRLRGEIDAGKTLTEVAYLQKWEKAR